MDGHWDIRWAYSFIVETRVDGHAGNETGNLDDDGPPRVSESRLSFQLGNQSRQRSVCLECRANSSVDDACFNMIDESHYLVRE